MGISNTFYSQSPRIALEKSVTRIGTVNCPVTIGIPVLRGTEGVRPLFLCARRTAVPARLMQITPTLINCILMRNEKNEPRRQTEGPEESILRGNIKLASG